MSGFAPLPVPATPFVGRAADLEPLAELLRRPEPRVLTLTGPAGVGKTRLAVEAARRATSGFADGAAFVPLADVREAAAVPAAVLHALGAADAGARPALDLVVDLLAERELLLVLDNFEQVVEGANVVATIAGADHGCRLLVTSRRPLGIAAEHCFTVVPLSLPDAPEVSVDDARRSDAVALFASRVEALDTRRELSAADVPVMVKICVHLGGLPLALELAAARCRSLSLPEVLAGLDRRLPLLTRGSRDLPRRHQTMADAVRWSYELLDAPAAAVFRRLGACTGGAAPDTVAALVDDLGIDRVAMLDTLDDLVAHSLVQRDEVDGNSRYRMLEVVREFAADELVRAGEERGARRRHALHFLAMAEECAARLLGREQADVLDRLHGEAPNLTAAVRFAVDDRDAEVALRLCLALRMLWYVHGSLSEGRSLYEAALRLDGAPPAMHARVLVEASTLARHHGDFESALSLVRDGLAVARTVDDADLLAAAQLQHGFALHLTGQYGAARVALQESLAIAEAADDVLGIARALHHLGLVAWYGDGDADTAWELQGRCLELYRNAGNARHVATVLIGMCELARVRGDVSGARAHLSEALRIVDRLADTPLLVYALHYAAALAAETGHLNRAVRLLGAADGLGQRSGAAPFPAVAATRELWLPAAARRLGTRRVGTLHAAGTRATHGEAEALAIATDDDRDDPLTRRERDIAELVAEGLTNRAIAQRLFIAERTVDGHVARILSRLDFSSRAQIAAWVAVQAPENR